ncbi:MAG TPA: AraC family transcriptional regulator [Planctomycetaceae bacterium]|jgi:AraC-like DNA-binding protein|nr:AraC family transcriptional regulator [Planctomycetaceae bacterium]
MSRTLDEIIAYRPLYQSKLVELRDYRCCADRGGPAGEEFSDINQIVLMRHGAFCKHFGRRQVAADVNQAVFFAKDSTYRISHPAECGDRGTIFLPAADVLVDMARQFDPSVEERPDRPFSFVTGPCDTALFCRHRELVRRLEEAAGEPLDSLSIDEAVLTLLADALEAAFARQGVQRRPRRHGTEADHADRVEAAKAHLARRLAEPVTLEEVAHAVHASPFHLARVFRERTGLPIHRYLTRLRLRAALEWLAQGSRDLTALALELGFSSHSHFTSAFRAEFGQTPSAIRRHHGPGHLRQMSKSLEV